jgi:hypothetical protein
MAETAANTTPMPINDRAEAEGLICHLADVMEALLALVEQETELVRAGKLAAAAKLEGRKAELSQLYYADTARLRASRAYLVHALPDTLDALRKRHDLFRALLQVNLTVLATARAVSESIMRGVSDELTRKATPQGYGASGGVAAPAPGVRPPLTLSRVL